MFLPRRCLTLSLLFCLGLCGCSIWPSGWKFGGSALDRNERAQTQRTAAQDAAVGGAQKAVHQAELALQAAPADDRAVSVGKDFVDEAVLLLDQARGAPTYEQQKAFQKLVTALLSENIEIRKAAERQRAADVSTTSDLAHRLAVATAAAERANERAISYAHESEGLADFARKLKLGFFAIIGLFVLGTVLSIAARFFPAFGLASKVVNGIVAPGITFAAHRAQEGLVRVGQGMARLRSMATNGEELIERAFDGVTDADHQSLIAAGAAGAAAPSAAVAKPPASSS